MIIRHPIRPLHIAPKSYAPHLLIIAILWAFAMTLDAYDAEGAAQESSAQLRACMNGEARWQAEDGTEIACLKAVTNKAP